MALSACFASSSSWLCSSTIKNAAERTSALLLAGSGLRFGAAFEGAVADFCLGGGDAVVAAASTANDVSRIAMIVVVSRSTKLTRSPHLTFAMQCSKAHA